MKPLYQLQSPPQHLSMATTQRDVDVHPFTPVDLTMALKLVNLSTFDSLPMRAHLWLLMPFLPERQDEVTLFLSRILHVH